MELDIFEQQLATILQNAGPGTVAELTDTLVAYWNGNRLVYAEVDTEGTGAITGTFTMDANHWTQWTDWHNDWFTYPVLSARHDLPRAD